MPRRRASRAVLDASALLALLNAEAGSQRVERALPTAVISAVNLSEVVGKLVDTGLSAQEIRAAIAPLAIEVHPFDRGAAHATGELRAVTRSHGLSLGDRACLALGRELRAPVLTADRRWARLNVDVEVRLIR